MNVEALSVHSAKDTAVDLRSASAKLGLAVAVASGAIGVVALILAGQDANARFVVVVCLALVWSIAGLLIAVQRRCPANAIVQSVSATLAVGTLGWSLNAYRSVNGTTAVVADIAQRLSLAVAPMIIFHLILTLPDGHLTKPWSRRVVTAGYATGVVTGLALLANRDRVVMWPIVLLWLVVPLAAPAAHSNYRAAGIADQRRMQWIGWAAMVTAEVAMVAAALSLAADWPHHTGEIALATTGLIPLAMIAGAVPRMLSRVDRLLTDTVSLAGLTALIIVAYLLALAAFGRRPEGSERTLLLLSMAASAGAAIAYQPARSWLTDRANRVVYGERVSPDEALRTWGSRLTRSIPLDELLLQLAEALRKSMQLSRAQIWVGADGHYEVAAMVPHRPTAPYTLGDKELAIVRRSGVSGGTWLDIWLPGLVAADRVASTRVAPIAHSGELLGLIVCERPDDRAAFDEDDDRVLTELARQVGLALHNVQLDTALQASLDELRETNEELRASRVRIVAAGDAERRKLERNLHDGAQQHLVALAVKLRLAKDAVVDDPADAEAMIDEVRADLQEAIAELRALAHGIFPPLLMSGGLAEALPAAAGRAALPTGHEIQVGRHPQEVEAAVYFCCLEALQNAGKHAGESASAFIKVWDDPTGLYWQVSDSGGGFDAVGSAGAGHGFVNMRDRMGAFGGTVDVVSSPAAGTTISGRVPL
jgi:signal transduction histidine kinase